MARVWVEINDTDLPFAKISRATLVFYFLCCCAALVVTLHTMNFIAGYDPLDYGLIVTEYISIDLWSFIHTFTFIGLGFLVPDNAPIFFLFGCLWELTEYIACNINFMGVQAIWNERITNTIWDLWFNSIGYFMGEMLLAYYIKRKREARKKAMEAKKLQ
ncbi:hypothetical protein AAMO2058_000189500 [Amorphochlora amoebiformis]